MDLAPLFRSISRKLELLSTVSSMREEIYEQEVNLDILLSFSCSRYPSNANSRDQESLNSSTQAKPEEQLEEHRQGAGVQPYPVIT